MIRSVIFDIDDTLYSYKKAHKVAFEALTDYAEKTVGIPADEFKQLHADAMQDLNQYVAATAASHNRCIRYINILEMAGKPITYALPMYETYWGTLLKASEASEGIVETIRFLKEEKGLRIGIGTDMTGRIQLFKLQTLGVLPFVDFMVCSESVGAEKPTEVFFRRVVDKALCKPEECLFIGDHLIKDVNGAMNVGMNALWYHPEGETEAETAGVEVLRSFTELPALKFFD